jgi:hypothetical protein
MEIKKNFVRGIMNKDLDDRLLPDSVYRDALNVKASSSDDQDSGTVQNYLGNTEMVNVDDLITAEGLSSTTNIVPIGSFTDTKNNYIYWFLTSDDYDIIFRYFESDAGVGSGRLVLIETRSTGIMNFNPQYLITGVNIVENLLFFTDGLNPPRRINVDKDYRDGDISENNVNVIVKPPLSAPEIALIDDSTITENTIEDKFIRFAYRYRYENNEYSSLSPFSKTAFEAQDFKFNFNTGRNESMRNKANSIDITVDVGTKEVQKIDIVGKDSRNNNTLVITTIDKSTLPNTNQTYTYKFKNNKVYTVLPQTQITRLFDNVPLSARAQDLIGSRIIYGNYKQFFDLKKPSGEAIIPSFSLSVQSTAIEEGVPAETFKSGRDYEVGIAYLDQFGRMTTVLESDGNGAGIDATVSIPINKARDKNELSVSIKSRAPVFEIKNGNPIYASKYRLFLKQNRSTYYNILPLFFHREGSFVYLQIAKYDIDKVKAGDYIYIKSTPSGISTTTEKYKVLEAEQKVKNFLGEGKSEPQEEGFYVKISVDSGTLFSENSYEIFKLSTQGSTNYGGVKGAISSSNGTVNPLDKYQRHIDQPVFYGRGASSISYDTTSSLYNSNTDKRIFLEITDSNKFRYRFFNDSRWIQENVTMSASGNLITYEAGGVTYTVASITFDTNVNYSPGDTFRINYRGEKASIFGSPVVATRSDKKDGGFAITTTNPITPGTVLYISINDGYDQAEQRFVSSGAYPNIEEWFFEEEIYSNFNQYMPDGRSDGAKTVFFRRATSLNTTEINGQNINFLRGTGDQSGDVFMLIRSYQESNTSSTSTESSRKFIYLSIKTKTPQGITILETEGTLNNDAIYYELPGTYPIESGLHKSTFNGDTGQTAAQSAVIKLRDFNAITFGNGMESSIIEDDWNGPELLPSPRTSAAIDRYEQIIMDNGLTYSGLFNESTSTNNLNEFNLSLANFKIIEKEYGPIQKLYSRDRDIIVFQEDKVSKVLFERNLLSDAVGGGSIVSVPEVLGTQMPYSAEYGISNNPESFAKWGNDIYFTDQKRGAVLNLIEGAGISVVSNFGMKNWFRDLFDDYPSTQKLGAYDPYEFKYVLVSNETSISACELEVNNDEIFISGDAINGAFLFNIETNSSWSISVANGSWLTLNATSGRGSRVITANIASNLSNTVNRTATITITYCDGLTKTVTVTQSYKGKKQVVVVVTGDKNNDSGKSVKPSYDFGGGSFTGAEIPIDNAGDYSFEDLSPEFLGQGPVPNEGDTVDVVGGDGYQNADGAFTKPFNPNLGDKMYYLDTDVLYDPADGDTLIANATELTVSSNNGINTLVTNTGDTIVTNTGDAIGLLLNYTGSFIYDGTGNYLYIIIDYRNNLDMGSSVTTIPAPLAEAPDSIRLNNTDQIGNYTITYDSDSSDIRFVVENTNGAVVADSGYVNAPSSATFNISKTLSGQDVIKVYNRDYTGGPVYDLSIGTIALTSASISSAGFDTVAGACASSTTQTIYHNGSAALPIPGNIIYTIAAGTTVFVGNNEYYKAGTNALQINNLGVVISSTSCICGESAVPTVIQSSINIVQNQDVSLTIQATNNPFSFAAAGNCREFSMFGGSGGAVFAGQDCKTGLEKQVFVSTNETITMCFFLDSVYKVAGASDATFVDVGGCVDTALPDGITFETLTGTLTGAATVAGNFTFTVTATNCVGTSAPVSFDITVQPDVEPNKSFFIDNTSAQATSSAACSLTPTYSVMYHDGILSYPVIRDIIFQDESGLNRLAGGNLWYRMDNGVVVKIDNEGIVQDTFLCGIITPTPPSTTNVSLAPGVDSATACASSAFVTYYYTGSVGVNPGKLYTNSTATTFAAAAWYKYEVEAGVFISLNWDGEQWTGSADCL